MPKITDRPKEQPAPPKEQPKADKPAVKLYPNGLPYRNFPSDGSDTRRGTGVLMD